MWKFHSNRKQRVRNKTLSLKGFKKSVFLFGDPCTKMPGKSEHAENCFFWFFFKGRKLPRVQHAECIYLLVANKTQMQCIHDKPPSENITVHVRQSCSPSSLIHTWQELMGVCVSVIGKVSWHKEDSRFHVSAVLFSVTQPYLKTKFICVTP